MLFFLKTILGIDSRTSEWGSSVILEGHHLGARREDIRITSDYSR